MKQPEHTVKKISSENRVMGGLEARPVKETRKEDKDTEESAEHN